MISLAVAGAIAAPARSAARPAARPALGGDASFAIPGGLWDVAATSGRNAWAVGFSQTDGVKTLLLHWNGVAWSQVMSPKPVYGTLYAVTAVSADDAWAVGATTTSTGTDAKSLVLHWNGRTWSRQAGVPLVNGILYHVAASANNVWAVGASDKLALPSLILHRTGNRWYVVPTDAPTNASFYGIAVTAGGAAWAGGVFASQNGSHGLLMRWTGAAWKSVANPLQVADNALFAVAAGRAGAVWAVGAEYSDDFNVHTATTMLWNGKTWRKVPVGPLAKDSILTGVTFVPGGTGWAGGYDGTGNGVRVLILRWTGRAWVQMTDPEKGTLSNLIAIAATSPDNAWAVGSATPGTQGKTLILHWNGKTWS
jgi:hypothetical protein